MAPSKAVGPSADPTPLGPLFDELAYQYGFEVPLTDRLRACRLIGAAGSIRDVRTFRLALLALLARSPEQRIRLVEALDQIFGQQDKSVFHDDRSWDRQNWLQALKQACKPPESSEILENERTSSRPEAESGKARFRGGDQPRPSVRERRGLTSLRIIPWPEDLATHPSLPVEERPEDLTLRFYADHPEYNWLDLTALGGPAEPMLDAGSLGAVADALGYFTSALPSRAVAVEHSIEATVKTGVPTVVYEPWRSLCRVLVLEDLSGEKHDWNIIPSELVAGLRARGVSVSHGHFQYSPESFTDGEGRSVRLEDLDASREGLVVLIVSTGAGLRALGERRLLEDLARWPRLAWLDPREERFWDSGTQWILDSEIPVFESTPAGLLQAAERLTGERRRESFRRTFRHPVSEIPEIVGSNGLRWAAVCAWLPKVSPSLAERIRRQFFAKEVPAHALGRLRRLPGTEWDGKTMRWPDQVLESLEQYSDGLQSREDRVRISRQMFQWFSKWSEAQMIPLDSVAGRMCEAFALQILLAAGSLDASEASRLVELAGPEGPLRNTFRASNVKSRLGGRRRRELDAATGRILSLAWPETGARPAAPAGMEWIPGGRYWMGDPTEEGDGDERPRHEVEVSEFWLGRDLVTNGKWIEVRGWAVGQGYELECGGNAGKLDHPVVAVSWHEAVRWCNAKSEQEGRRPAYWVVGKEGKEGVYRRGEEAVRVEWTGEGYRLPTEAEWEKAARGGLEGHHYPWESRGAGHERFIDPKRANYGAKERGTTPVGKYGANGYGLRDMAGNVWEWCWDWKDADWYTSAGAREADPRGSGNGAGRVIRGGCWWNSARDPRCAERHGYPPSDRNDSLGFRFSLV